MKKLILIACVCALSAAGCGVNHLKLAQDQFKVLQKEYADKSRNEIDNYEPIPVNISAAADYQSGRARALADQMGQKFDANPTAKKKLELNPRGEGLTEEQQVRSKSLQFITGQWRYEFGQADYMKEPYTVTANATYLILYYRAVPKKTVEKFEKEQGRYFDPREQGVPIQTSGPNKMETITFTYSKESSKWEETNREVTWEQK